MERGTRKEVHKPKDKKKAQNQKGVLNNAEKVKREPGLLFLEGGTFWRLRQPQIFLESHRTSQLLQHRLDGIVSLPAVQHSKATLLHLHVKFVL